MEDRILEKAIELAGEVDATAVIVIQEESPDLKVSSPESDLPIYVVSSQGEARGEPSIDVLGIGGTFIERLRDAVMMAYVQDKIDIGDRVVGIGDLDKEGTAIVVYRVEEDPLLKSVRESQDLVSAEVMRAVITLAVEIGREGREGRPVGTMFVVGDSDKVMASSHQLLLNPFEGHPTSTRDVTDPETWESVKEIAQIEGAFVLDDDGVVLAGGRYLDVDAEDVDIIKGLGAKHTSAAAISRMTDAVAVVVAESGGVVRIFKDGSIIGEIEPRIHVLRV
ncbi:MAG: hypothetical protein MAG715_01154 [Methanonatronarchaeales archaeon]|nr:hypothetical protein [Methanonatronarchaeales archaeon]